MCCPPPGAHGDKGPSSCHQQRSGTGMWCPASCWPHPAPGRSSPCNMGAKQGAARQEQGCRSQDPPFTTSSSSLNPFSPLSPLTAQGCSVLRPAAPPLRCSPHPDAPRRCPLQDGDRRVPIVPIPAAPPGTSRPPRPHPAALQLHPSPPSLLCLSFPRFFLPWAFISVQAFPVACAPSRQVRPRRGGPGTLFGEGGGAGPSAGTWGGRTKPALTPSPSLPPAGSTHILTPQKLLDTLKKLNKTEEESSS